MERDIEAVKGMFVAMTQRGERSPLFWWLVENHDAIAAAAKVQRIQWSLVVEKAEELGLTNRAGGAPTRKLAKLTWQRAQAHVARTRSGTDAPVPKQSRSFVMPRSANVRPSPAEHFAALPAPSNAAVLNPSADLGGLEGGAGLPVLYEEPIQRQAPETSVQTLEAHHPQSFPVAVASDGPPTATGTDLAPVRPAKVARVLTPEQIAHREKVFASARAQLDYSDRFIRLKE